MITLGDKWWLTDAEESRRGPTPGLKRYFGVVAAVAALCVASIVRSSRIGALPWALSAADVASSAVLPRWAVATWRVAAALGISALSITRCFVPSNGVLEDLDRKGRTFAYSGIWRYQGLTGWSWLLINAYFLLSAALTLSAGGAAAAVPSAAANLCQILLGTASAFALLVTIIVTFVLIPNRHAKGLSVSEYFRFQPIVMHNGNIALMGMELWLTSSRLPISLHQLPFALLFGCAYVLYHNGYRYRATRTLLYFFLNWTREDSLKILMCLLAFFGACYTGSFGVSALLAAGYVWAPPAVALGLVSIMKFRQPKPLAAA